MSRSDGPAASALKETNRSVILDDCTDDREVDVNVPLISLVTLKDTVLASVSGVGRPSRLFPSPETHMADKKTSPKVASKASKILSSPASKPAQKSVAASDLSQSAGKAKAPAKTKAPAEAKASAEGGKSKSTKKK